MNETNKREILSRDRDNVLENRYIRALRVYLSFTSDGAIDS